MSEIKDSGNRREFDTGFVRDMADGKGRFDLLPWNAIWELAKHCEDGAKKYGERNIDKGAPQNCLIDSAIRHLAKYLMGWGDEPHLRAAMWNIAWALEQETTHRELQNIPNRLHPDDAADLEKKIDEAGDGCQCKDCRHWHALSDTCTKIHEERFWHETCEQWDRA